MRTFSLLGLAAVWVTALMSVPPAQRISVAVHGPADSDVPEPLTLEIGNQAWLGYGGGASADTLSSQRVRLVGTESCREYADFVAEVNTNWIIRFSSGGTVAVEDWTGRPMDAGPALPSGALTNCPEQPITQPVSSRDDSAVGLALVVALAIVSFAGVVALGWTRRRVPVAR